MAAQHLRRCYRMRRKEVVHHHLLLKLTVLTETDFVELEARARLE